MFKVTPFDSSSKRSAASGFTLVELLVVISVIAVLIAMLMPMIRHGSASAERVKCVGNERSTYGILTMYAAEHEGWLPTANSRNPYTLTFSQAAIFNTYMKELNLRADIWYCPSLIKQLPEVQPENWNNPNIPRFYTSSDEFNIGYSYVVNPIYNSINKFVEPPVRKKSEFFTVNTDILADVCIAYRPPSAEPDATKIPVWRSFPHFGKDAPVSTNVLRGDGSVARRMLEDMEYRYRYIHSANSYW